MLVVYLSHIWMTYFAKNTVDPDKHGLLTGTDEIAPSVVNVGNGEAVVDDVEISREAWQEEHGALPLTGWRRLWLWLPTLCDLTSTTLMNVGLLYCSASIYQMLRGAVVIFTGTFSVLFLSRRLYTYQWTSLFLVVFGVTIVGLSSILFPQYKPSFSALAPEIHFDWLSFLGVGMILFAQVFTATQFVLEEKIMAKYYVRPLMAVGLEGIFGLTTVLFAMPFLHLSFGKKYPGGYFDIVEGWRQVVSDPRIWGSGVGICFSVAFFNFFGLSVTRTVSATSRSLIDTCRTFFIWLISLYLGWERFIALQVLGFFGLILGTLIFNDACPCYSPRRPSQTEEEDLREDAPLLRGSDERTE